MSVTQAGQVPELPDIPGEWTEREIIVGSQTLRLILPALPDAFLDDPAIQAANEQDDFMPYWPYLWPASHAMAARVVAAGWPAGTEVLEIGAGVGLVGLAALAAGLKVTLSDYAQTAVDVALHNARRNGFHQAEGLNLDWRNPPDRRFPVILGCDVIYERRSHSDILHLLDRMLTDDGMAWMGDAGRQHAPAFIDLARERGFRVELEDEQGRRLAGPQFGKFQLIVVRKK